MQIFCIGDLSTNAFPTFRRLPVAFRNDKREQNIYERPKRGLSWFSL